MHRHTHTHTFYIEKHSKARRQEQWPLEHKNIALSTSTLVWLFLTHLHVDTGSSSQPVVYSERYKSFSSSVVNWAFSECWPVCHCVHRRFVHSERRKKISQDYPWGENPQEASRSARVHFSVVWMCQGGEALSWMRQVITVKNTTVTAACGKTFIQQSALRT